MIVVKPKILFLINNFGVGGAERLTVDDINEMLRRGLEVKLISLRPEKEGKSLASECLIPASDWVKMDFGSMLNAKSWYRLVQEIKKVKPNTLITQLWYSNIIGKIAGRIAGVKNIICFEQNVYDTLKTRKMFFLDRITQNISTHIVAVSNAVKNSLLKHGINRNRIKVIHNSVNVSKYKNINVNLKKQLGLEGEFVYIFIGRLIHQKGIDILLQAFSKTKEGVLIIVGEGVDGDKLKVLSKELGLTSRVQFLGVRQDIPELLYSADCFVLASRYEGLPLVLAEAIAARKAIVLSSFESAGELIEDGKNGVIVPKENVEALAKALQKIKQDGSFREALIKGVSEISDSVSIESHVDKLLALTI